jgi:hypothetical protein
VGAAIGFFVHHTMRVLDIPSAITVFCATRDDPSSMRVVVLKRADTNLLIDG